MASEIVNAVNEVEALLKTISSLRRVFSDPPAQVNYSDPTGMVSVSEATWEYDGDRSVKGLHTLQIGIYKAHKDIARDHKQMLPYADLVKDVLLHTDNFDFNSTIDTITTADEPVEATLGQVEHGDNLLFGWTISIPIKIRSIESGSSFVKG